MQNIILKWFKLVKDNKKWPKNGFKNWNTTANMRFAQRTLRFNQSPILRKCLEVDDLGCG